MRPRDDRGRSQPCRARGGGRRRRGSTGARRCSQARAAALAAALPGGALAAGQARQRKQGTGSDAPLPRRDTDVPGCPAALGETFVTVPVNGFYGQIWNFWEHTGTHLDVPAHFIVGGRTTPQLTLDELMAPIAVDRHLRARCAQAGHRRHDRRPAPLRARARKDQAWLARGDELGVGRAGGQRGGVPEHRRLRDDALPRLERGRSRVADR